ncbi:MAG: exodeoxyribonuclease VII large subunit [Clostridiales bacterium]|nr:exodeoxyribonuclease VII large subunit [Clostridiales bacterium]
MSDYPLINENTISVSEVNATIKACIDAPIFKGLEVYGEVSGFKFSGPHAYFTLKDKNSQLQCVCFYAAKTYNPKDGESVIVRGGLDYYVKGGRLSLQVNTIKPVGQGLLFLEFERLKAKLEKEGLFAEAHKKAIPMFPKNVLVVTSKTGAVIRDIVTTVRRKNPVINIVVRDVRVQGEGAGHDIAGVLARVDTLGYDVIIIARGGGSLEDLAPFYDEELVRAVYNLNTPVISAVGHETDFSLCDFVADVRAATPTAAGELVAYDYYGMLREVREHMRRLTMHAVRNYKGASTRALLTFGRLRSVASTFYAGRARRVERAIQAAKTSVERKFDAATARAERATDALDRLSPIKILKRGYFRLQLGGDTVSNVSALKVGDTVTAMGGDGNVEATVTKINLFKDGKEN